MAKSGANKKLEALKKGEITDCSFLVGPEDSNAEEIHACKFDMMTSSEFFAGLLKSPLTPPKGPIRITGIQTNIFRMVVEFIHTGELNESKVSSLDEGLQLAEAAQEYLCDDLGLFTADILNSFLCVENVWKTYSGYQHNTYVTSACEKVLSSKTEECLIEDDESDSDSDSEWPVDFFYEISEEAFSKFLSLDHMNISSEKTLLNYCLEFVKRKKDDARAIFRRAALPYLRLLTLAEANLTGVLPYLTPKEKSCLALHLSPLLQNEDLETLESEDQGLCLSKIERNYSVFAQIDKNEKRVFNFVDMKTEDFTSRGGYSYNLGNTHTFTLTLHVKRAILVTGFDLFQLRSQDSYLDASVRFQTNCNCGATYSNGEVLSKWLTDSGIHFETKTRVPRGGIIKLKIQIADQRFHLRSISAQQCVANAFNLNDALAKLIFKKIDIDHSESNSYSLLGPRVNIFKRIDYMLE